MEWNDIYKFHPNGRGKSRVSGNQLNGLFHPMPKVELAFASE
jgi:hypothetical protein